MNIYDVSKKAGVSIATVSRVLNGNANVSDKTKNKVLVAMKELDYTPNIFARGLGLNTMKTIGIMCSDSSDTYLANAVYYLEQELRRHNYDSILCCTGQDSETKKKYLDLLISKRVDGIILAGSQFVLNQPGSDNRYILNAAKEVPIVLANGFLPGKNIYSVMCNDTAAVYDATSRLIAAMADASYNKSLFHLERYEEAVLSAARALVNQYDAKQLAETDPARRAALRQEANEALAAEVKARAADTLDKVLFELSSQMKNAYSRSDA